MALTHLCTVGGDDVDLGDGLVEVAVVLLEVARHHEGVGLTRGQTVGRYGHSHRGADDRVGNRDLLDVVQRVVPGSAELPVCVVGDKALLCRQVKVVHQSLQKQREAPTISANVHGTVFLDLP